MAAGGAGPLHLPLVKFEGHTQGEVASMQRISQATVSRIIDRYERWQAHADPREGGRLDPAERLRAQRWLTYERNELILGTALRIARAVEGTAELWKTVRTEPGDPYRRDKASVKDETTMIDRTGVAARFLRLAFKVNMEQLALVEKDPPPLPGHSMRRKSRKKSGKMQRWPRSFAGRRSS